MSDSFSYLKHLEDVDRQIRIQQLRQELEQVAGLAISADGEMPDYVEEAFLEYLLLVEKAPRTSYAKILIKDGVFLPSPDSLKTRERLHSKLWQVIRGLGRRGVYLCNTDHVSDRELYSLLWYRYLNDSTVDVSRQPGISLRLDLLGSGSLEDVQTYLRYYADEEERQEWAQQLGDGQIPERGKAPYNRDRFLPKRPG